MVKKISPSVAWVWDKFRAYAKSNDLRYARLANRLVVLEKQNNELRELV